MATVGGRIKEERKRLGLSQAEFAKKIGIHRQTQINYESGDRKPDTDYLGAVAEAGVDVGYVLTERRETDKRQAYINVVGIIRAELELSKGFDQEWTEALELVATDWKAAMMGGNTQAQGESAVRNLLNKSPALMRNPGQLEDVIEKLEFVLEAKGWRMPPSEKADAILQLFREAKKPGARLDFKAVEVVISRYQSS